MITAVTSESRFAGLDERHDQQQQTHEQHHVLEIAGLIDAEQAEEPDEQKSEPGLEQHVFSRPLPAEKIGEPAAGLRWRRDGQRSRYAASGLDGGPSNDAAGCAADWCRAPGQKARRASGGNANSWI
jgi:hypothetical protein